MNYKFRLAERMVGEETIIRSVTAIHTEYMNTDLSLAALAQEYGAGVMTVHKLFVAMDLPRKRPGVRATNTKKREMRALRHAGIKYARIGEIYGISKQRVHQVLST